MSEEVRSTLKIPIFDKEEKNFQSWMIRFLLYTCVKGLITVLTKSENLLDNKE